MEYKTFAPHPHLSAFVKCYWTLDAPKTANPEKQRIVPDGCIEMIFHYGDLDKQYLEDGPFVVQPRCFVFGQITRPLEIEPTGTTGIFSTCFYPDSFKPFATMDMGAMANRAVPLTELFGDEGGLLEKAVLEVMTNEERIKVVEDFLLGRLAAPESVDRMVKCAVETILSLKGSLAVDELSGHLKVNRRQLERKFAAVTGLSPKQLCKMTRLQFALKQLGDRKFKSLTDVAYEGEYYDQAHFIRDFKEFTGMTPKKFYAGSLKMSSLFLGIE